MRLTQFTIRCIHLVVMVVIHCIHWYEGSFFGSYYLLLAPNSNKRSWWQRLGVVLEQVRFQPSDDYFWFKKLKILLNTIHIILFLNSFGISIFIWTRVSSNVWTYGFKLNEKAELVILTRISGVWSVTYSIWFPFVHPGSRCVCLPMMVVMYDYLHFF